MRTYLAILALAIAGCGGGSSDPEPLATGTSTAQGGDPSTGDAVSVIPAERDW